MLDRFWALRNPSRLAGAMIRELWRGRNILVRAPSGFPPGLIDAVRAAGREELIHEIVVCPALDASAPFDFLVREYAGDPSNWTSAIAALLGDPGFEQRVFWVRESRPPVAKRWIEALSQYAQLCQGHSLARRMLMVVEAPLMEPTPASNVALEVLTVDAVLDRLDVSLLVADSLPTEEASLVGEVTLSVLVELAIWDPDMALRFSELPLERVLEPGDELRQYAAARGWDLSSDEAGLIAQGAAVRRSGKLLHHSAFLAATGNERLVATRVWRGQIRALFPAIEEARQFLVQELGQRLKQRTADDPADLEIGPLATLVSSDFSFPVRSRRLASASREIRNHLAHRSVVNAGSVRDLARLIP